LKQFQENKKAIHPRLIEVGDFLLDIIKKSTFISQISKILRLSQFFML